MWNRGDYGFLDRLQEVVNSVLAMSLRSVVRTEYLRCGNYGGIDLFCRSSWSPRRFDTTVYCCGEGIKIVALFVSFRGHNP